MRTHIFDPAEYLDDEETIEAYLEEARAFGDAAVVRDAQRVVSRARARLKGQNNAQ